MVEVVVVPGASTSPRRTPSAPTSKYASPARGRSTVEPLGQLGERRVEIADAERHVLERAAIPRSLRHEERELAPARVRPQQGEPVRPVDHVHPEVRREEVRDQVAVGDPVGNVVELRRVHGPDGTGTVTGYAELEASTCGGRPHAGAAPSSSASGPRYPSASPRCRAAPSSALSAASCRTGARRGGRTRCQCVTAATRSSPRPTGRAPC